MLVRNVVVFNVFMIFYVSIYFLFIYLIVFECFEYLSLFMYLLCNFNMSFFEEVLVKIVFINSFLLLMFV